MMCYQMKSETEQFNIRPDKTLVERLQKLADKFNRRSKAQIAVEIIEQYIDFWEDAETIKFRAVQNQREKFGNDLSKGGQELVGSYQHITKVTPRNDVDATTIDKTDNARLNFNGKSRRRNQSKEAQLNEVIDAEIDKKTKNKKK